MLFQNIISPLSFKVWVRKDEENNRLVWLSLVVIIISFSWLKIIYPYPNFMPPDSYSYLRAAQENLFINTWPIGYSKFLRLISSISQSHLVLVIIQYLLLQVAVLYFLFTIRYLLSPGKWLFRTLLVVSITNPLLPHISNFVSSDCLFASLSLVWFTQLLWILVQPSKKLMLAHAVVLLLAFTVRFMAIYYPLLSVALIFMKSMPRKTKTLGIGSVVLLLSIFIGHTQYEYNRKTNTIQFSAFGGWQIAANALYGYAHAKPDDPSTMPEEFKILHKLVNLHMDSLRQLAHRPDEDIGIYYLWDFKSPLFLFMVQDWKDDTLTTHFKKWASMAPIYQEYGRYLILKHPKEFLRYYIWPNLIKYYAPPVKFMGTYNLGFKTVEPIAVTWFDWKNNQLPLRSKDREIHITNIFPTLLSIINPLFLFAAVAFVILGGYKKISTTSKKMLGLMLLIWIANMFFSVLSAPTELRYQLFPIIITIPFCGLFIAWIIQSLQTVPVIKPEQQLTEDFTSQKTLII